MQLLQCMPVSGIYTSLEYLQSCSYNFVDFQVYMSGLSAGAAVASERQSARTSKIANDGLTQTVWHGMLKFTATPMPYANSGRQRDIGLCRVDKTRCDPPHCSIRPV